MNYKKQTAVDWLVEQIDNKDMGEIPMWIYDFIEQAKEMDKQQIIETWNTRAKIDGIITFTDNRTAEQYYKETYETSN